MPDFGGTLRERWTKLGLLAKEKETADAGKLHGRSNSIRRLQAASRRLGWHAAWACFWVATLPVLAFAFEPWMLPAEFLAWGVQWLGSWAIGRYTR